MPPEKVPKHRRADSEKLVERTIILGPLKVMALISFLPTIFLSEDFARIIARTKSYFHKYISNAKKKITFHHVSASSSMMRGGIRVKNRTGGGIKSYSNP